MPQIIVPFVALNDGGFTLKIELIRRATQSNAATKRGCEESSLRKRARSTRGTGRSGIEAASGRQGGSESRLRLLKCEHFF